MWFPVYLIIGLFGIVAGLGMIAFGLFGRVPFFYGPSRAVAASTWDYWKGRLAILAGGPVVILVGLLIIAEGWAKIGHVDSSSLIRSGLKYQQRGDYDAAIKKYSDALATGRPWSVKAALGNRAMCYAAKEMWNEAIADFERTLEKAPKRDDLVCVSKYAMALEKVGRYQEALREYDRVLKYDKNNAAAQVSRDAVLNLLPKGSQAALRKPLPYKPTASHCGKRDTINALSDGLVPRSSSDNGIPRMTWWDHKGGEEWVQYTFEKPRIVSGVAVYWYDDTGRGWCRVPDRWQALYRKSDSWHPVDATGPYEVAKDRLNKVSFPEVETDAIRLVVELHRGFSGGILEWQVEPEQKRGPH